jgi:hypothetical protein
MQVGKIETPLERSGVYYVLLEHHETLRIHRLSTKVIPIPKSWLVAEI